MANNSVTTAKPANEIKTEAKRGRPSARIRLTGSDGVEFLITREKAIVYLQTCTLWLCDTRSDKGEFPKLTDFGGEPPARQGIFSVSEKDKPLTVMNMMLIIQAGGDASTDE